MADRTVRVRLLAEVSGFKQAMKDARSESERTAHQFDRDGKMILSSSGQLVRSAQTQRDAWSSAGGSLATFGTAGVVAMGAATKAAIDWESSWAGVLKTVDGTHDQLAALEGDLRQMASTLPATHTEVAAVAEAAGQLGVQVDNIAAFTRVMIDLGETTNLTADEAATSLAQLMNIMRTAPGDVDNLGSAVVALGNNGASTERDIVQMAQRIAGAGKTIGLSEGDVLGLANALASVGIEVEAGGSAISNIMIDIAKAVSQNTPELQEWARVAGMSADEFSAAWRDDPTTALDGFVQGLGRANAAGEDVFGTLDALGQSDVRVTRALLAMASSGSLLAESIELGNQAFEDNNALLEEAEKRYDTTAAKLDIARNSIHDAAITIGDTFLPALAGLAEGAAGAAQAVAGLPDPVQNALGVLGGAASVAALAGGSFLLLAPRVIDTVEGIQRLRAAGNPAITTLGRLTRAASLLTVALSASAIGIDIFNDSTVETAGVNEYTKALLAMADGADISETSLAKLFERDGFGSADWFNTNTIDSWESAFNRITNPDGWERTADIINTIGSLGGSSSAALDQAREIFSGVDRALATMVQSGEADRASDVLSQIAEAAGVSRKEIRALAPEYVDALAGMDVQQQNTADSAEAAAAAQEQLAAEQQEIIDQWKEMAGGASKSFIDMAGAYQSVIDKNTELAQATADATESTSDGWQDFYDGLTVDSQSFIKQLESQVDAQLAWQENMFSLGERISGLSADAQANGQQMLDELIAGGVDSAPMVQMLANVSDADFQHIVDLWGNKGTEASEEFASKFAEILGISEPPAIPLDADMTAATNTVNQWLLGIGSEVPVALQRTATRRLAYDQRHQGFSEGGGVWGAGSGTSDSIPAWLSNGEYVQTAAAHKFWGTSTMDAMRRRDVGEVLVAVSRMARQGYAEGGPVAYPSQSAQYLPPQVVTVPVESRFESHSPVQFTGDMHVNDYEAIMREARAARRLARLGGNRG